MNLNVASSVSSFRRLVMSMGCMVALLGAAQSVVEPYVPIKWSRFVQTSGQSEPIPEQWLYDVESRVAHSLVLPSAVPRPAPYQFDAGVLGELLALPSAYRKRATAYFDHLCRSEAGEWIFERIPNVDGFYYARPEGRVKPTSDLMADPFGPEMPWLERMRLLRGDSLEYEVANFIEPPLSNFVFVEEPRRQTRWQAHISDPYIRIFGYTSEQERDSRGVLVNSYRKKTPMKVVGIPSPTAKYAYTWRGIKRAKDREYGIAGGELIIYERQSQRVLAVRRQFLITLGNGLTGDKAAWEVAAGCPSLNSDPVGREFKYFAIDVLQSTTQSQSRTQR